MATFVVYADYITPASVESASPTYSDANTGAGTLGTNTVASCGQYYYAGNYKCHEAFLTFDTSGVSGTLVFTGFSAYVSKNGTGPTAGDIEVRLYDFGGTVDTGDFVSGSSLPGCLGALTLLATLAASALFSGTVNSFVPEAALATNISATNTRMVVVTSDEVNGVTPPTDTYAWYTVGLYNESTTSNPCLVLSTDPLVKVYPDADLDTTGWSTAPLWSKVDETTADSTVITATAA